MARKRREFGLPSKEVRRQLQDRGCVLKRSGKKDVFTAPNGMVFILPGEAKPMSRADAMRMNQVLRAAGLDEIKDRRRDQSTITEAAPAAPEVMEVVETLTLAQVLARLLLARRRREA